MSTAEDRRKQAERAKKWRHAHLEQSRRISRESHRRQMQRDPEKCRAAERAWNRAHPGVGYAQKVARLAHPSRWAHYLFLLARKSAAKRGLAFTISEDDIQIPRECPIFGTPFTAPLGGSRNTGPSIDRIDSSRGYVPGNVHVISFRANRIKNDATSAELRAIADYLDGLGG